MPFPTAVERIAQDIRYAGRGLRRSPGFALTAVASLALGIGANTAMFTVVNSVLLKPLPFPDSDRLVQLWEAKPSKGDFRNVVNGVNFLDWREHTHSFTGMAAVDNSIANLTGAGEPVAVDGSAVSPEYFSILGVPPVLGRSFTREEGIPGRDNVVILSYALWQSRFGADSGVLGRKIWVNGEPCTVIGVMPRGFALPSSKPDLWLPLPIVRSKQWEGGRFLTVVARLKPGVSLQQAQADLESAARQAAIARPRFNQGWSAQVVPMLEDATGNVRVALLVLLAAVAFVFSIACANVANLVLMRSVTRSREMAVRAALGAGKRRLIQQLLAEGLVLAALACAAGIAVAHWGLKALLVLVPQQHTLPRAGGIHIDGTVFAFAVALALLTAALFGLAPAWQVSQLDPHRAMQSGSARISARSRLRQAFVVAEIALSFVLLIGAGLMLRSFHRLMSVNPGFDTQHILTMEMFTSPARYLKDSKRAAYFRSLLEEVRRVPGVRAAGTTHFLPLQDRISGSCFNHAGEGEPDTRSPGAQFLVVSPGYFQTMKIPIVRGRDFDARDAVDSPSVILVNQAFVRQFLGGRNPIGERLNVCWTVRNPAAIAGVVADARQADLNTPPKPTIFVDNLQSPMFFAQLVVRAAGDPKRIVRDVENAIHRVDPDQALTHVEAMDQVLSDSVAQPRFELVLLAVFGGMAGLLAIVGIYGVVAYSAAQRTREIGIRAALGAASGDIRAMVLREGMSLALGGIGLGLAGALALTRLMRTLLYETRPADPATLAVVAAAIFVLVLGAALIPANRAARVDPLTALRYE